jgi:hypothetical protein
MLDAQIPSEFQTSNLQYRSAFVDRLPSSQNLVFSVGNPRLNGLLLFAWETSSEYLAVISDCKFVALISGMYMRFCMRLILFLIHINQDSEKTRDEWHGGIILSAQKSFAVGQL